VLNFEGVAGDGGLGGGIGNDSMAMVGVAIVDGKFKHAANYHTGSTTFYKPVRMN
jgi:hypothetical protein